MNKTLILISKTPIVIQIFTLVCKKLSIKLEVLREAQIDHKVDITIVDKDLIDDRFNILKTYSKVIGAISNKELSFEMANDFLIPLPFLPSALERILDEQLQVIRKKENSKTYISTIHSNEDEIIREQTILQNSDEELEPAMDYLENLADGIAQNVKGENDDSIVSISSVENQGGILDINELSKIEDIFNNDIKNIHSKEKEFSINEENNDQWHDLSSIIDDAINEVNTTSNIYDKLDNKPIKILLNNYSLTELTPLLNMLDQDIINTLTDGYDVTIQLKLGKTNE